MTRKEQAERKEANYQLKKERVLKTLELFVENDGKITDEKLARALILVGIQTSSSTVGRDLTENLPEILMEENRRSDKYKNSNTSLLTDEQLKILAFIKKARTDNKLEGNAKGGIVATTKNNVERVESGKFNGCRR